MIDRIAARIAWSYDVSGVPALVLEELNAKWVALDALLKDPNSQRVGQYSEDKAAQIAALKAEVDELKKDVGGITFRAFYEPIE
jgi:hypothetical protein